MSLHKKHSHIWAFVLLLIATSFVFVYANMWLSDIPEDVKTKYGITFSTVYSKGLGLDDKKVYKTLLDDLNVKYVRLPVYWSEVETEEGIYDWSTYDWLVDQSNKNDVNLTMVVGAKVPRWPECFVPDWVKKFNSEEQHKHTMNFIGETVKRYRNSVSVDRWQVENEPFFPFGECEEQVTMEQFNERVSIVRELDNKPIQVTVSGELGPWKDAAKQADILGLSMYRQTWNDFFGHFMYPISPEFYYLRAQLVKDYVSRVIVSELQAEPWFPEPIENRPILEWYDAFDVEKFENNLDFARKARLLEAYLWGAEWWYLLKENGDDRLWNVAKSAFAE